MVGPRLLSQSTIPDYQIQIPSTNDNPKSCVHHEASIYDIDPPNQISGILLRYQMETE